MSGTSRSERTEQTREGILRAALTAFAERGFHGTSTREIAKACGMSPTAMYVHFSSKESLLFAISRAGHESTLAVVRAAADTTSDPVAQLEAVVAAYVRFHIEQSTVARVINYEMAALDAQHRAEIRTIRRHVDGVLRGVLECGQEAGVLDVADVGLSAAAIASMGIDLARWHSPDRGPTTSDVIDTYVRLARRIAGRGG